MVATDRYSPNAFKRLMGTLNSVSFRDDMGEIEYFGQKVVMLRRDAFRLMKEELSKRQATGTANIILTIVGRRMGVEEGKALVKEGEGQDWETTRSVPEFIRIAMEESNMGYGKIQLKELETSSDTVRVSVSNGFETEPLGRVTSPSCYFMLGYLEGIFSQLLDKQLVATEEACGSVRGGACLFKVVPGVPPSRWKL